jgi:hypothetical protein
MRYAGIMVIAGSVALAGLLLLVWVLGLVAGFTGGGLIHLLLVLAILVAPAGVVAGAVLILTGGRARQR